MQFNIYLILLFYLLSNSFVFGADQLRRLVYLNCEYENSLFNYPMLELRGRIAEEFEFFDAKPISGITCRVTYKGIGPFPKKIYFSEFDQEGKPISEKTELVISKIKPGERGFATFRVHVGVSRIVIWAEDDSLRE